MLLNVMGKKGTINVYRAFQRAGGVTFPSLGMNVCIPKYFGKSVYCNVVDIIDYNREFYPFINHFPVYKTTETMPVIEALVEAGYGIFKDNFIMEFSPELLLSSLDYEGYLGNFNVKRGAYV